MRWKGSFEIDRMIPENKSLTVRPSTVAGEFGKQK